MNLHCEHLGSTTKLLLLLFWFLYSTAHEPFFLVASRLVDNCSDLYITHSRHTPKIERLDRWQRRSADIYKFLNLTWTSTFPAPCWGLIPSPGSAKSFNFQIETISRSSVYLLQIDIIGISAFNARPGTNHPYFLAFLLAFTDSSNLPAHNLRCCLLVAGSFALVCRFIPSSKEKRILDQQLSTEMDIIARSARLGTKLPLLAFLLPLTDSFASPGQETSLLLALLTAHSLPLALLIQLPQKKIVWAIDLSAESDVIGISAYNARPGMSYPYLLFCCSLQTL